MTERTLFTEILLGHRDQSVEKQQHLSFNGWYSIDTDYSDEVDTFDSFFKSPVFGRKSLTYMDDYQCRVTRQITEDLQITLRSFKADIWWVETWDGDVWERDSMYFDDLPVATKYWFDIQAPGVRINGATLGPVEPTYQ